MHVIVSWRPSLAGKKAQLQTAHRDESLPRAAVAWKIKDNAEGRGGLDTKESNSASDR